ncbi:MULTISPECIES: DUF2264 domain-containing protein [Klebsiella]|uniref:DUF2264 domain-containing protein n=1 Tax=Klebsiella TaxID=570 RepID=UPI0012AC3937
MRCGKIKSNPLSSMLKVIQFPSTLLGLLSNDFSPDNSGLSLWDACAHYGPEVARMEGLSWDLWGVFTLLESGEGEHFSKHYIEEIKAGTDPQSRAYWGDTCPYDQRLVEMAVYGLGLALLQDGLTEKFSEKELSNLYHCLNQISASFMPDSNWDYFAILVQLGFKRAGLPRDNDVINQRFEIMSMGKVVVSAPAGQLYDKIGFKKPYIIMGCIALTFTLILSLTLSTRLSNRDHTSCASNPNTPEIIHQ